MQLLLLMDGEEGKGDSNAMKRFSSALSVDGLTLGSPLGREEGIFPEAGQFRLSFSAVVTTTDNTNNNNQQQLDQEQPTGRGYAQTANAVKCAGPLLPIPELKVAACGLWVLGSLKSGLGT